MRTTLDINDDLVRQAKERAAHEGRSLTSLIEDALRAFLTPQVRRSRFRLDLPVVAGKRSPSVDVSDRDALYDLLQQDE